MSSDQLDLFYRDEISEYKRDSIQVCKVSLEDARDFYCQYHYSKGCSNSATSFGVYPLGSHEMLACVSFQTPCSEAVRSSVLGEDYKNHVAELGRLAIKHGVNMSASMFVKICIEAYQEDREQRGMVPIYALISFADGTQSHHGGVYQAMSWVYTGRSKNVAPVYKDATGRMRHRRQMGVNISKEEAIARGWTVTPPEGFKYRYIKVIHGSKRQRKRLKKLLKYVAMPYPKPNGGAPD